MTKPKFKDKYRVESIRLPNHDYGANGWYFVTICTHQKQLFFGDVIDGQMYLSPIGEIAQKYWSDIPNHFDFVYLDAYIIMPNHVHGIVVIDRPPTIITDDTHHATVETRYIASLPPNVAPLPPNVASTNQSNQFGPLKPGSLQTIIHAYKSAVTRWCGKNGHDYFKWQPRFYENTIRDDGSLDPIRQYIINNPNKWGSDRLYIPIG